VSLEPHYIAGLDLGQAADYSALVVVEVQQWIPASAVTPSSYLFRQQGLDVSGWVSPSTLTPAQLWAVSEYWHERPGRPPLTVPHMERWPLGTPYPTIVQDVVARLGTHPLGTAPRLQLIVDATGCGAPVVDMLRQAGMDWLIAATIHAGNTTTFDGRTAHIPKRDLIAAVTVALEQRRLQISRALPEAATLERELGNFRRRSTPAGHETMASWREQQHDDLVLGLALAVWVREWRYHNFDAAVADHQAQAARVAGAEERANRLTTRNARR
jgi:hypothetical protein